MPLFDEVRWQPVAGGNTLTVKHNAPGRRLKTINVNGQKQSGYFVPYELFRDGGEVEVVTE